MFQTAPGVTVPYPEKISEGYQIYEGESICANISCEKLKGFVTDFYKSLPEPLFFVLQVPLSLEREKALAAGDGSFHQQVLYLDGQTQSQIDAMMSSYGQLLLNDGISQFAIASR